MKTKFLTLGLISLLAIFGLFMFGCSGDDTAKTDAADGQSTLPEDSGDQTLLDTTMTEEQPPVEKPPAEPPKEEKKVVGGHLISAKVEVTNEIVLLKTDLKFKRKLEESTGLEGMFLEEG